jgi:hypothetical protein
LDLSHQWVKNWFKIDENEIEKIENRITRKNVFYSGLYVTDEQFTSIGGEDMYRVTLYDKFVKGPIAEEYNA